MNTIIVETFKWLFSQNFPIRISHNSLEFMFYSIGDIFPLVSLNFEGGASMILKPEQYLMHNGYRVSMSVK